MPYSDPQEELILNGVMDQDSADHAVAPNNYRYALNFLNKNNGGKNGSHVNIPSNLLIDNPFLPIGRNVCIGYYEDIQHQSIIYFIWNEDGYHSIFKWYPNKNGFPNGEIENVYQIVNPSVYDQFNPNPLGFDEYHLITGVHLVDDLLCWTDTATQPKTLNIKRINLTDKKREFNLFLTRQSFANPTTYTINIYSDTQVAPIFTFVWNSVGTTYIDRVAEFIAATQLNPALSTYVSIKNNVNYVSIEMANPGQYFITINEVSTPSSIIVPTKVLNVSFNDYTGPAPGPADAGWLGINNNSTGGYFDNLGLSVLGANNLNPTGPTNPVSAPALSYFTNPTASPITIKFDINAVIIPDSTYYNYQYLRFDVFFAPVAYLANGYPAGPNVQIASASTSQNTPPYSVHKSITITLGSGQQYGVWVLANIQPGSITQLNVQGYVDQTVVVPSDNNESFVVANNFYPDITATPFSYIPLQEELITSVKYPPQSSPSVKYTTIEGEKKLRVLFSSFFSDPLLSQAGFIGLVNNSTDGYYDQIGVSFLGGSIITSQLPFFNWSVPQGGLTNSTTQTINLQLNIEVTFLNAGGSGGGFFMSFAKWKTATPFTTFPNNFVLYQGGSTTQSRTFPYNLTLLPGETWGIFVFSDFNDIQISTIIEGSQVETGNENTILTKAYQFRAKYIYKDNEESVYGAISAVPLPQTGFENAIEIDFSDERLNSVELVSALKAVVLCVSPDNSTTWYEFKTLDPYYFIGKDNQKYLFTENQQGTAVAPSAAILPYNDIPLKALSQEYIDDRLFYGGITTGYNKLIPNMTFDVSYVSLNDPSISHIESSLLPIGKSFFRRGYSGIIGVIYYDDADRCSPVLIDEKNSRINIPYHQTDVTDNSFDSILAPAQVLWAINHAPPSWATKYQLVRTRDLSQMQYLMFVCDSTVYSKIDPATGLLIDDYTTGIYMKISFANIPFYQNIYNVGSVINFNDFVAGDRIRFLTGLPQGYSDNDHEIVKIDGTDIYIKNDGLTPSQGASYTLTGGALCVIYSPVKETTEHSFFYEFGECYPIKTVLSAGIKSKYHTGPTTDQQFNALGDLDVPATGTLINGDVFYRFRDMPFSTNKPSSSPKWSGSHARYFISSNTPNEGISDIWYNNGRVKSSETLEQVFLPTGVIFTDRYITGTKTNGLNSVQASNYRVYSTVYGALKKMFVINNDVLRLLFANGYQLSLYVNQGVIRQSGGGQNLVSIYDDVAGNSHIIQRTLSTLNPESVVLNDEGDLFGYDEKDGSCWRSSGNGTVNISDYYMSKTWADYADQRILLDRLKSKAPAVYDLYKDLFIVTLYPLAAAPAVMPSLTLSLRDLNSLSWTINVRLEPDNITYFSSTAISLSWMTILTYCLPPAFTLVQNDDGSITITADDISYNDKILVISGTNSDSLYDIVKSFQFTGGSVASDNPPFTGLTLCFHKQDSQNDVNGWKCYFDFVPEYYGRLKNTVVSFSNGELWVHNSGPDYNNFYGVQYDSTLRYVVNKNYPMVKNPLSVWYRGRGAFGAKVFVKPNDSAPLGMETEMIPASFELIEGTYSSNVMKNKLDPAFTDVQQAWVNGEDLKGTTYTVELSVNDDKENSIDSVKNQYFYSDPN